MKLLINILFAICFCFILGCSPNQTPQISSVTGVKFTDIEPAYDKKRSPDKLIANLVVHKIRISAENYSNTKKDIWGSLIIDRITFENKDTFDKNGLNAGFGTPTLWKKVKSIIQTANPQKPRTTTMTIEDGLFEDIYVQPFSGSTELFYTDIEGKLTTHKLTSGKAVLRLFINDVPQTRSFINLKIVPAYIASTPLPEKNSVKFGLASFDCDLDQGQFVIFGPEKFQPGDNTLKGMFFSKTLRDEKNYVELYIIACVKIID